MGINKTNTSCHDQQLKEERSITTKANKKWERIIRVLCCVLMVREGDDSPAATSPGVSPVPAMKSHLESHYRS